MAKQCLAKAEYLKGKLRASASWELPYAAPTFNEFVARRRGGPVAPVLARLAQDGLLAGVDLGRFHAASQSDLLVCVTERHSRAELDRLVAGLA